MDLSSASAIHIVKGKNQLPPTSCPDLSTNDTWSHIMHAHTKTHPYEWMNVYINFQSPFPRFRGWWELVKEDNKKMSGNLVMESLVWVPLPAAGIYCLLLFRLAFWYFWQQYSDWVIHKELKLIFSPRSSGNWGPSRREAYDRSVKPLQLATESRRYKQAHAKETTNTT